MTQAKITKPEGYKCAPNGATVQHFAHGEVVSGQVAKWAIADRAAQAIFDPRTDTQAIQSAPEVKRRGRPRKGAE
jgi:hypothetical protein